MHHLSSVYLNYSKKSVEYAYIEFSQLLSDNFLCDLLSSDSSNLYQVITANDKLIMIILWIYLSLSIVTVDNSIENDYLDDFILIWAILLA